MKMKRIKRFTMIEMMVAMAVLVIFLLALMRIFTATQNISTNATGKISQFERARIVMDMIATDLQTLYYRPDSNMYCYYQTAQAASSVRMATVRSEAGGDSNVNKNPVAFVIYDYSDGWTLKGKTLWAGDTGWDLYNTTDPGAGVVPAALSSGAASDTLIEGVKTFKLTMFRDGFGALSVNDINSQRAPGIVQIELELYSQQTMDMYDSDAFSHSLANIPENVKNNGVRKFVRVVNIKREL